jgi:hypothetical protein
MTLQLYTCGKSSWYPLERRLGGPESRYGIYGEATIFEPTGTRNPALGGSATAATPVLNDGIKKNVLYFYRQTASVV